MQQAKYGIESGSSIVSNLLVIKTKKTRHGTMRKLHPIREHQLEAAQNNVFGLKNLNNNNTSMLENPEDTSGINEANR